jgi:hypothetical protein
MRPAWAVTRRYKPATRLAAGESKADELAGQSKARYCNTIKNTFFDLAVKKSSFR